MGFREAVLNGQAPDKGLYFPETIPLTSGDIVNNIRSHSKESLALEMMMPYVGDDLPRTALERIIGETINFDFRLVKTGERLYALELFHGPTLAFKDVGARFLRSEEHTSELQSPC